jgi:hypothetical protein
MNAPVNAQQDQTAILAMAFGAMFQAVDNLAHAAESLDDKTAREAAVLFRVIENRLSDSRREIESGFQPDRTFPGSHVAHGPFDVPPNAFAVA